MHNDAVKKLPYLLRYVPDQYKTKKICDKAILENSVTLNSVSNCHQNQEMCNKAVVNYPHALGFVLECYKKNKAVHKHPTTIKYIAEC